MGASGVNPSGGNKNVATPSQKPSQNKTSGGNADGSNNGGQASGNRGSTSAGNGVPLDTREGSTRRSTGTQGSRSNSDNPNGGSDSIHLTRDISPLTNGPAAGTVVGASAARGTAPRETGAAPTTSTGGTAPPNTAGAARNLTNDLATINGTPTTSQTYTDAQAVPFGYASRGGSWSPASIASGLRTNIEDVAHNPGLLNPATWGSNSAANSAVKTVSQAGDDAINQLRTIGSAAAGANQAVPQAQQNQGNALANRLGRESLNAEGGDPDVSDHSASPMTESAVGRELDGHEIAGAVDTVGPDVIAPGNDTTNSSKQANALSNRIVNDVGSSNPADSSLSQRAAARADLADADQTAFGDPTGSGQGGLAGQIQHQLNLDDAKWMLSTDVAQQVYVEQARTLADALGRGPGHLSSLQGAQSLAEEALHSSRIPR